MLSQSVCDALRKERQRLLDQVKGIDALLSSDATDEPKDMGSATVKDDSRSVTGNGNGHGEVGLRSLVRELLKTNPKGLSAREVAKMVAEMGYKPSGSMRTIQLVHSDLSRLRRGGKLVKRGLRYSLPVEAAN